MGEEQRLHIVSWNVAGWRACVREMSRSLAKRDAVHEWLEQLSCDVLCVQETKVRWRQVAEDAALCARSLKGYETFWSCNEGLGGQRCGLNGVATFSRLPVLSADPTPLGDPMLDAEGRALLTDHGTFCVLNIYAPNGSSLERCAVKRRFAEACRNCVDRQSKPVIVCGDLNAARRATDMHWTLATVDCSKLPRWREMRARLIERECQRVSTKNTATGEEFARFRCRVADKWIGAYHSSMEAAYASLDTDEDMLGVRECLDAYSKLFDMELARTHLPLLDEPREHPLFDCLVDSFAELYPNARERFTCWDQYTNKRYENIGARIDYILVDPRLFRNPEIDNELQDDELAALRDATLDGAFRPAPFEGSGLPDASARAYTAHLKRVPSTTMLYTPPSWSDHIAMSLCVAMPARPANTKPNPAACRKAQPHSKLRTITQFFKPAAPAACADQPPEPKRPKLVDDRHEPRADQKRGLLRYFHPVARH